MRAANTFTVARRTHDDRRWLGRHRAGGSWCGRARSRPLELVDDAIARIERTNPQLNAVIHERFERARAEARGAAARTDRSAACRSW